MLKRIKDSIFDILRQADWLLLCLCCGAALFGLVMIASATNFLNSWKMVIVQACAIVLGVGIYFLMSQIDLTEAAKRWKWLLGFGIVMFLLLKTPLGIENNGNRAWLGIQGFPANIQPAEIVKLTFILVLSRQLVWVKENWGLKSLRSIAFLAGHVLLMVGLYYVISSDMGSALVYVFIFAAMAFVAGVAARWFIIALLGGGAAFYLLWELDKIPDYMKERFMVVFDHNLDPLGAGWQQTRSLLALGGGSVITNWPVDLSAVSSLTASINKFDPTETYSAFNIYLLSAWPTINADNSYVAAVRVLGNQQATSVTLNTSGYNGSYYVLMGFSNNNSRSFTGYIYSLKCNF